METFISLFSLPWQNTSDWVTSMINVVFSPFWMVKVQKAQRDWFVMMSLLTFDPTLSFIKSCELYFCHICVPVPFGLGHCSNNLRDFHSYIVTSATWTDTYPHKGKLCTDTYPFKGHNLVYSTHFYHSQMLSIDCDELFYNCFTWHY